MDTSELSARFYELRILNLTPAPHPQGSLSPCFASALVENSALSWTATKLKQKTEAILTKKVYVLGTSLKICSDGGHVQHSTANNVYRNVGSLFLLQVFLVSLSISFMSRCMALLSPSSLPDL